MKGKAIAVLIAAVMVTDITACSNVRTTVSDFLTDRDRTIGEDNNEETDMTDEPDKLDESEKFDESDRLDESEKFDESDEFDESDKFDESDESKESSDAKDEENRDNESDGKDNADIFNLVYMSFELPEGWEKDNRVSTYSEPVFAPDGNVRTANGYIGISRNFSSSDYVEALLDDAEYTGKALTESMGDSVSDVKVEAVKDTFMGDMAKVEMRVYDDEIDSTGTGIVYYGYYDYTVYMIMAFISDDADEEETLGVRAALDMIFETGEMKD